jgi:hypothetical protein
MMAAVRKNKKVLMIVGGVAALAIVGKVTNDKYGWFDNLFKKEEPAVLGAAAISKQKGVPATAVAVEDPQPRGKLPWSVGDVGLWDDENPNYCTECTGTCDQSYSNKSSTQCELCQGACAASKGF